MEFSTFEFEWIDRYLDGQLQGQELKDFKSRLSNDKAFREQVKLQKAANNVLLENELFELRKQLDNYTPPSFFNSNTILSIIAVVCFVALTGGIIYKFNTKQELIKTQDSKVMEKPLEQVNLYPDTKNPVDKSYNQNIKSESPLLNESQTGGNDVSSSLAIDSATISNKNLIITDKEKPNVKDSIITEVKTSRAKKHICDEVQIIFDSQVVPTCEHQQNGSIQFTISTIKGGEAPYRYSIDEGENYSTRPTYSKLSPGKYGLSVIDANGCKSKVNTVYLTTKQCITEKSYVINPDAGESWTLPEGYLNCNLYIYDQSGNIVYQTVLHTGQSQEWNGISSQGRDVGMGQYLYTITCQGELKEKGYITIVR